MTSALLSFFRGHFSGRVHCGPRPFSGLVHCGPRPCCCYYGQVHEGPYCPSYHHITLHHYYYFRRRNLPSLGKASSSIVVIDTIVGAGPLPGPRPIFSSESALLSSGIIVIIIAGRVLVFWTSSSLLLLLLYSSRIHIMFLLSPYSSEGSIRITH